jgi:L-lactate utilization protein LutC
VRLAVDFDEARAHVLDILAREGARLAVVSPDAAALPWHIAGESDSGPSPAAPRFLVRPVECHDPADELMAADAGITTAEYGLADTGTLVVLSSAGHNRLDSLAPPVHIALVGASDLLPDLAALLARLSGERRFERHAAVTFITGPSRTADIELTLTVGVHGPRKVFAVLLQEPVA